MGFTGRTDLADFHIFSIEETYPSTRSFMPPYSFRFFCITLFEDAGEALLEVNTQSFNSLTNSIAFQSPEHVVAWVRDQAQRGFIIYFQPEFLNNLSKPLLEEFPFFRTTEPNFFILTPEAKARLHEHCLTLSRTFLERRPYRLQMLQTQLLTLLYECHGLYDEFCHNKPLRAGSSSLTARFKSLVENHFLTQHNISYYSTLLSVSPNYLSQVVAAAFGQTVHGIIADRQIQEAKKLLHYTELSIGEIANYMGFTEPTHFGRFFKRHTSLTPGQFRKNKSAPL